MAAVVTSVYNIQRLVNLQNFNADWNAIENINLSGLENLIFVDISDNDEIGSTGLKSINLNGCTSLQELRLDDNDFSGGFPNLSGLTNLTYLDFDQCNITGSVDISFLTSLTGFDFNGNTGLTELIISDAQPIGDGNSVYLYNCALTEEAVDNILVALSTNGVTGGYVDLTGGTNAPPSVTGLAAKTVLEGNSWTVDVNIPLTTTTTTP